MSATKPVAGEQRRFDYLFKGSDATAPDLNARHGQEVVIVRELRADGDEYDFEGDYMFLVRFSDGYEGHAYDFELVKP